MIKKVLLTGILALSLAGCTNPVGKAVDYVQNGSRKAKVSDYPSIKEVTDFKEQVSVYDNFVEVGIGKIETPMCSYILQEDKYVESTVQRPRITYKYSDFNQDGYVDEYHATNEMEGKTIVSIKSKVVWDAIYEPQSWTFHDGIKYADDKLQKIINEDYKTLREKGTRLEGKTFTPAGTWYNQEDYPIKMDEESPVKIEIEIKK